NIITPKFDLVNLYSKETINFPTHWVIRSIIYKDSIIQNGDYRSGKKNSLLPFIGYSPRFRGSYTDLEQKIAQQIGKQKLNFEEILLEGKIEVKSNGKLKELIQIYGENSFLSNIAIVTLMEDSNIWNPAVSD